jgi:hypothetical protein
MEESHRSECRGVILVSSTHANGQKAAKLLGLAPIAGTGMAGASGSVAPAAGVYD